jgi:hypothetical protein
MDDDRMIQFAGGAADGREVVYPPGRRPPMLWVKVVDGGLIMYRDARPGTDCYVATDPGCYRLEEEY